MTNFDACHLVQESLWEVLIVHLWFLGCASGGAGNISTEKYLDCEAEKGRETYTQPEKNFLRIAWYDFGFFNLIRSSSSR